LACPSRFIFAPPSGGAKKFSGDQVKNFGPIFFLPTHNFGGGMGWLIRLSVYNVTPLSVHGRSMRLKDNAF
jgi:hypothetical protein